MPAPWMIGVIAISIYDHKRAISRVAERHLLDADGLAGGVSGPPILFYGLLPAGLTFFLYVRLA